MQYTELIDKIVEFDELFTKDGWEQIKPPPGHRRRGKIKPQINKYWWLFEYPLMPLEIRSTFIKPRITLEVSIYFYDKADITSWDRDLTHTISRDIGQFPSNCYINILHNNIRINLHFCLTRNVTHADTVIGRHIFDLLSVDHLINICEE